MDARLEGGRGRVAYETIEIADGSLPLLPPMSEVAGRMAVQVGAICLESRGRQRRAAGRRPGRARRPGRPPAVASSGATPPRSRLGMGAESTVLDMHADRWATSTTCSAARSTTLYSNRYDIDESVRDADLVIGAVLVPGAGRPSWSTRR